MKQGILVSCEIACIVLIFSDLNYIGTNYLLLRETFSHFS